MIKKSSYVSKGSFFEKLVYANEIELIKTVCINGVR